MSNDEVKALYENLHYSTFDIHYCFFLVSLWLCGSYVIYIYILGRKALCMNSISRLSPS